MSAVGSPANSSNSLNVSAEDNNSETTQAKKYGPDNLLSILKPVTLCMCLVSIVVKTLPDYSEQTQQLLYTPLAETDSSSHVIVSNVFLNSLIFLSFVVVMTVLLVILYVKKFYKVINGWLMISTCLILFLFTYDFLGNLFRHFRLPLDLITASLLTWNIGVLGVVHIHLKNSSPPILNQAYLIYISMMSALIFIRYLPQWTTWAVLGILAIWDLVAVLCPRGPLRVLVETAQRRQEPIMPALIYSAMAQPEEPTGSEHSGEESSGPKLGLGDFIFYSILIGRSSTSADTMTVVMCIMAILVGLIFTMGLLVMANRALPALPISIALGVAVFFMMKFMTSPFISQMVLQSIFI